MGQGKAVSMFRVGQMVTYATKFMDSKVFATGKICKLHPSGRQGVAEIYPSDGTKKISRKLQHVTKLGH